MIVLILFNQIPIQKLLTIEFRVERLSRLRYRFRFSFIVLYFLRFNIISQTGNISILQTLELQQRKFLQIQCSALFEHSTGTGIATHKLRPFILRHALVAPYK